MKNKTSFGTVLPLLAATAICFTITATVKPSGNELEIDIVNLWPNHMIGDAALPAEKRFTRSNVTKERNAELLDSGLLGPVTLQAAR